MIDNGWLVPAANQVVHEYLGFENGVGRLAVNNGLLDIAAAIVGGVAVFLFSDKAAGVKDIYIEDLHPNNIIYTIDKKWMAIDFGTVGKEIVHFKFSDR